MQWDFQLFQAINNLAANHASINSVMRFLSQDAEYFFYLGIMVYWFTRNQYNRRMVSESVMSACVALGISGLIGMMFYRNRPFVDHHVNQLIEHAANASFPSDHATAAFVISTGIWLFRKKDGWLWLLLAFGISFSRLWTGVHYPTDVIAGMILGIFSAQLVHYLFRHSRRLDNGLTLLMNYYEKVEQRFWAVKKVNQHDLK